VPRVLVTGVNGITPYVVTIGNTSKNVLTGALTANTLSTVLSVTGSGVVNCLSASGVDATSRTHRLKITIDGVVALDVTSTAIAAANKGIDAIGTSLNAGTYLIFDQIPFNTSFLVEYASSVTETGKTTISYLYRTN
jgi:hypothetical protein